MRCRMQHSYAKDFKLSKSRRSICFLFLFHWIFRDMMWTSGRAGAVPPSAVSVLTTVYSGSVSGGYANTHPNQAYNPLAEGQYQGAMQSQYMTHPATAVNQHKGYGQVMNPNMGPTAYNSAANSDGYAASNIYG